MRTAFDNSQRDFLSFFMHDQKVHSFKIASALFPPIASVCPRSMKSLVSIVDGDSSSNIHSRKSIQIAIINEIMRDNGDRCLTVSDFYALFSVKFISIMFEYCLVIYSYSWK